MKPIAIFMRKYSCVLTWCAAALVFDPVFVSAEKAGDSYEHFHPYVVVQRLNEELNKSDSDKKVVLQQFATYLQSYETMQVVLAERRDPGLYLWQESYVWVNRGNGVVLDATHIEHWAYLSDRGALVSIENGGMLVVRYLSASGRMPSLISDVIRLDTSMSVESLAYVQDAGKVILDGNTQETKPSPLLKVFDFSTRSLTSIGRDSFRMTHISSESNRLLVDNRLYTVDEGEVESWKVEEIDLQQIKHFEENWPALLDLNKLQPVEGLPFPRRIPEDRYWTHTSKLSSLDGMSDISCFEPISADTYRLQDCEPEDIERYVGSKGMAWLQFISGANAARDLLDAYRKEDVSGSLKNIDADINYDYAFRIELLAGFGELYAVTLSSEGVQYGAVGIGRITVGKPVVWRQFPVFGDAKGIVAVSPDGRFLVLSNFNYGGEYALSLIALPGMEWVFPDVDVPSWGPGSQQVTFGQDGATLDVLTQNSEVWTYRLEEDGLKLEGRANGLVPFGAGLIDTPKNKQEHIVYDQNYDLYQIERLGDDSLILAGSHGIAALDTVRKIPRWQELWPMTMVKMGDTFDVQPISFAIEDGVLCVLSASEVCLISTSTGIALSAPWDVPDGRPRGSGGAVIYIDSDGFIVLCIGEDTWKRTPPKPFVGTTELEFELLTKLGLILEGGRVSRVAGLEKILEAIEPTQPE